MTVCREQPSHRTTSRFPFPSSLPRAGTGTGKPLPLAPAAASPAPSILWFGPCGAFFRPGRLIQKPARAAAVKDGRHRNLATCSPLPGHP